jgi:predicted ATP-dependent serine protease
MGEGEYYQCSSCSEIFDANQDECPSCGDLNTLELKTRDAEPETEPERRSTEVRDDKIVERTPEEVIEETAAHVAELGGTPQRPIP